MRRILIALATLAGAVCLVGLPLSLSPAAAQFFPFFAPYQPRMLEQPREAPADYSEAPSPKKPETAPTTTVVVMGDSMADWLAYGLEQAYADTPEMGVVRKIKRYSGLIRYETKSDLDWPHVARDILAQENPAAVVVIMGLSDRKSLNEDAVTKDNKETKDSKDGADQSAKSANQKPEPKRGKGATFEYQTDAWAEQYAKLIDQMIAAVKSKGVPVLWVGLPAVCCAKSTADTLYLNDLFRTEAEKNGIVYVDAWDGFVDDNGKYSSYGPDVEGQTRRLRSPDGVYFTQAGARKLAHYVERELSRVMSVRATPVALPADSTPASAARPGQPRPAAGPVLPLNANATADSDQLLGGGRNPRGGANSDAARVLVKGEPVAPLKGRADDFGWSGNGPEGSARAASENSSGTEAGSAPPSAPAEQQGGKEATPGKQTDSGKPANKATQGNATENAAHKRPAAAGARDVPRPPAPIGRSSGSAPLNLLR